MKWIVVTRPFDGSKVYVNADNICAICGNCNEEGQGLIVFAGEDSNYIETLESPEAIMNLIKMGEVTT